MNRIPVDVFKDLYFKIKPNYEREEQAVMRDLTPMLDQYIYEKIEADELVNIGVRGEPGTGKTVIALELMRRTNEVLSKKFGHKIDNYKCIASDQIEFNRMIPSKYWRNMGFHGDRYDVCVEIDEFSALSKTGANATTEEALGLQFSDLFRRRYVHRISCTPTRIQDDNAYLILDVESKDPDTKTTQVRITYRYSIDQDARILGIAKIDVSKVLQTDWYRRYEKKKLARLDLLDKYGVRDIRELETARYSRQIVLNLKDSIHEENNMVIRSLVDRQVESLTREDSRLLSLLANEELVRSITGMLITIKSMKKAKNPKVKELLKKEIVKALNYWETLDKALNQYMEIE